MQEIGLQWNEGIVSWQWIHHVRPASPSASYTSEDINRNYRPDCNCCAAKLFPPYWVLLLYVFWCLLANIACLWFAFVSLRPFTSHLCACLTLWSLHNQDNGLHCPDSASICSLSMAIYTWDGELDIRSSLLRAFCDRYAGVVSLALPFKTQVTPSKVELFLQTRSNFSIEQLHWNQRGLQLGTCVKV